MAIALRCSECYVFTMTQRRHAKSAAALELTIAATIAFAAMMVALPAPTQALFNLVAFGSTDFPASVPAAAQPYVVFVYRVLGAVMLGWMLALLAIVRTAFRRGEPWAWWAIATSVGGWLVIDTTASLLSSFPGNALLNAGFGLAFAVPLVAARTMRRRNAVS